ncbi:restriction endonuclease subunit S [Oryzisolibacter sp. LB2S]|uniref:restriction endonuclease subunit S n=1 Tax=Alicycliphilus soli TaxID=3228789 RepID=UPI003458BD07
MSELAFAPLARFADVVMGQSPGADLCNTEERGLPFLQGCAEFGPRHPHSEVYCAPPLRVAKTGSVLISVRAPVGTMNYADRDYCIGRGLGAFKAKFGVSNTIFLKHAVELNAAYLHRRSQGSTFAAVSTDDVKTVPIPVFMPDKQEKIATILTSIDTAIEKTEALIAKYQQIKAGLMHDLFTRGVQPNGQLRPPREQAPELYQETAIGWIPREWSLECANTLCSLITKGTTPASDEMWQEGDGIRFLRVDNLTFDGQLSFDSSSFRIALKTHLSDLARSRCLPDDVLTNIVGPPLGKVSLISEETGEVNINQAIALFRPRDGLDSGFLLYWLTTETVKRWFLQRAKQTSGQLNLTLAMCQELPVPSIGLHEQKLILARAQGCERRIQSEWRNLCALTDQKSGLMHDLLTGKVPVTIENQTTTEVVA